MATMVLSTALVELLSTIYISPSLHHGSHSFHVAQNEINPSRYAPDRVGRHGLCYAIRTNPHVPVDCQIQH